MAEILLNPEIKTPRIAAIATDPPVKDGVLAWGLSPVNKCFFKALDPYLGIIFCSNARLEDIEPQLQKKCILINRPFIFKSIRKIARMLFGGSMCNKGFRFILPKLVRQLKEAKVQWVFSPCDSNPFELERAILLAQGSQLPLAVYLVDDFIEGSRLVNIKDQCQSAMRDLPHWIGCANKVFVISEGFRERIKALYGIDATVLPLVYDLDNPSKIKSDSSKYNQIIFVGNMSHFYADGVKALATILDELNKTRDVPLVLRVTLSDISFVRNKIGNFKCIQCAPCQRLDELKAEIASSLMAFVPYSFDVQYKIMTETSFPSKILPCLAAARHVLVYGPEYSSLVRYFREHEIGEILSQDDLGLLRESVLAQVKSKTDNSEKYRQVLREVHDPKKVMERFLAVLQES